MIQLIKHYAHSLYTRSKILQQVFAILQVWYFPKDGEVYMCNKRIRMIIIK